jgi:hypothetical protein
MFFETRSAPEKFWNGRSSMIPHILGDGMLRSTRAEIDHGWTHERKPKHFQNTTKPRKVSDCRERYRIALCARATQLLAQNILFEYRTHFHYANDDWTSSCRGTVLQRSKARGKLASHRKEKKPRLEGAQGCTQLEMAVLSKTIAAQVWFAWNNDVLFLRRCSHIVAPFLFRYAFSQIVSSNRLRKIRKWKIATKSKPLKETDRKWTASWNRNYAAHH